MLLTSSMSVQVANECSNDGALTVLDARVDYLPLLVASLPSADIVILDPAQDGVEQITTALKARRSLSSLHIVSHGSPGRLHLGDTQLSFETLDRYATQLRIWADILKGRDVLIYGCQVAEGALGYLFLQQLHQLIGANLAASEHRVGRIGAQANWVLETEFGHIQTPLVFSEQLQASYPSNFETVNFSVNTNTLIESEGTPFSLNFSVDGAIPPGGSIVRLEGSIAQAINQWDLFQLSFTGLAGGLGEGIIDVSPAQDFSAFNIVITEPNASINFPIFNDFQDDSPQEIVWTVSPVSEGTTVSNGSATVTIYDDPSEVPAPIPEVSLTSDITTLVEDEGTEVTFTVSLSEPPPEGGIVVAIGTGKAFALGDFDIFPPPPQASATGGQLVGGFSDNSGFNFLVTAQTATITLPIFDDLDRVPDGSVTNPDDELRNDDQGEEQTTFTVQSGDGYTVAPNANSVALTLRDTNVVNTPPVADDDSYSTAFNTALTIDAGEGVLNGDTDADGDPLSAEIATDLSNGAVTLNADGSFTYTPNADFSGDDSFTYTVSDGNGGTDTATVTVSVAGPVNTPPVADDDGYNTAFNTALTIDAANGVLDGDTDADGDPLSAAIATNPSNGAVTLNADGSFTYTPNADFSGDDSFTYTVSDGNGGSDEGVVTVTVGDNTGGEIVVSFTATPDSLNEEEGTPITFDFTVTGDFPQEGIIIRTDENFFPNPQLDFNLLDFENPEVISGIEFVDFEEVSTGRFLIDWRLTQPEAFIKVAVFDDNLAEPDGSFTTGLLPREGYTLDPDATTATVFVTDGVDGVGGPVVSLAVDQTEVNEGDPLTITLAAEGDIPADGLEVFVDSETVGAIGDFITVDSDGNPTVTFTGLAGFPAPNEDGSGFTVVMNDNTATISFDVFDDGPGEGLETFEFSILDGENYDVSAEASSVAISIDEGGTSTEPVVSLDVAPAVVSEEEEGASVTLTFTVEGEIPTPEFDADGNLVSGGLSILFDGSDVTPIFEEITGGPVIDGFVVGDFADPAQPNVFEFVLLENTSTVTLNILNDVIQEADQDYTFGILPNDAGAIESNYVVNPEAASDSVTLVDGNGGPGIGPTVGLSVSQTELNEGDAFTVNFTVDGEIPAEGIQVLVDSPTPGAIGEFVIFDENGNPAVELEGIAGFPEVGDGGGSSFLVTITEPEASLTLSVFEDGPNEGLETLTFDLVDGEIYEVAPDASSVALTINDGGAELPVVSFTATPDSLNEEEGTSISFNFTVTGEFPAEGVIIRLDENFFGTDQLDFNVFEEDGLEFVDFEETSPGRFTLDYRLTQPEASITTAVFNDNVAEPDSSYTTGLLPIPDANYTLDPNATTATIFVTDGVDGAGGPVVSLAVDKTEVNEGDSLTITLTAEGEIPAGGIEVFVDSGTGAALGEFITVDENGVPMASFTGISGVPAPDADASGFTVIMVENTATITIDSVFDDGPTEGPEPFEFRVVDGENYDVDANANTVNITINDGGEDAAFAIESGVTSVFLDLPLLEEVAGLTLVSADSEAEPFSEDFLVGFAITDDTDFSFAPVPFAPLGGTIEHSGTLTLGLGGAEATIGEFSIGFDESRITDTASGFFVADTLNDPLGLEILFDISGPGTVAVSGEDFEISGADLLLAPELAGALGLSDLAGADVGDARIDAIVTSDAPTEPVVSLDVAPAVVSEEEDGASVTLTFTVEGEIPAPEFDADGNLISGGLSIIFDGSDVTPIFEEITGGPIVDGFVVGDFADPAQPNVFEFVLLENTSTVTLNILNDVIQEADQDYTFGILPNDAGLLDSSYTVNPEAASGTVTLVDGNGGPGIGPTVGLSVSQTELNEGDTFTVNFTVDGEIPTEGVQVLVDSPTFGALGEFVIFDDDGNPAVELEGIAGFPEVGDGGGSSFLVTITEPEASMTLSVFEDGPNEGLETLTFDLVDGEVYEVAPDASSVILTINDFEVIGTDEGETLVGDDINNTIDALGGDDIVAGGLGDDIILGGDGDDVLRGDLNQRNPQDNVPGGDDIIFGGNGDDRLGGKAGNDILSGDAGNDLIWGDDGDDILMGVTGNDILVGDNFSNGSGSDLFVFGNGDGTDTVLDFEVGIDRIGLVEGELTFGDLTITQDGGNTLLGVAGSGEVLAVLNNVQASALGEDSFAIVPDVSNPDEALSLV